MIDMEAISNFGGLSGASCVENIAEATNMLGFAIDANLHSKTSVLRMYMNASYARLISGMSALVSAIFLLANIAKIADSVVARVTIDMVNVFAWKLSIVIQPSKSMRLPYTTKYIDPDISSTLGCSAHHLADLPPWELRTKLIAAGVFKAREHASIWIVVHIFFKLFLSNHCGTLVKAVERMRQPLTGW